MPEDNKIVHGLWIGEALSSLEQLTIHSFIKHGHEFHLWVYEDVKHIPAATIVEDANRILDADQIFQYKEADPDMQFGKGSFAGFSDIFRYKLLYEQGGWWSDMDVTCLKPLDFEAPYVFRDHNEDLSLVGNIMKCPPGSRLMRECFARAMSEVDADNRDWKRPVQILCDAVENNGLGQFIREGIANRDVWDEIEPLLVSNAVLPSDLYVFHWCHENWRLRGIDKHRFGVDTTFAVLLVRFGVLTR